MLPSSPELERGGLRDYAGGIEQFSSIQIQLG
jgi:hypothetical protein